MLRIGIIGTGYIARAAHLPSLAEMNDVELAAACDIKPEAAETAGRDFKIPQVFTDWRKMLEQVQLDAVYVCLWPHLVMEPVLASFERGLHVFLEKPPGTERSQTENMAAAGAKARRLNMVGFHRRFSPASVQARKLVEEHGSIDLCQATYVKNLIGQPLYGDGKTGLLTSDVIHALDNLRWLGGEVRKIRSSTRRLHADYDDSFNAILEFESGAVGLLMSHYASGKRIFSVTMHGKSISAYVEPEEKAVIYKDGKLDGTTITSAEAAGDASFHHRAGFFAENRHFIDCLKSGKMPMPNMEDAAKSMELIERFQDNPL